MIVKDFLEAPGEWQALHKGKGRGKNSLVFEATEFETPLNFIRYVEMEPGSSIGVHRHGENEEIYVVLSGNGVMIVNGVRQAVKRGDVILNKPGWEHGLENTSPSPLNIFVFEVNKR